MSALHNSAFETLFDPSSPSGSTASANSYLSFSALADFRNPQDPSGLEFLEKWQTGSQRPKMDETAFSDLFFSNPSPYTYSSGQTDTGMSPWALSPASLGSADASIPSLPLPQASCSSLGGLNDVLFPEIDLLDAVDPYDCSMSYPPMAMSTRNPALNNKASNESMLSAASGQSEFLLTPRHSTQQMNHGWDDLAVLPHSAGSSVGYVERLKDSRSGSSSSAWSGGISLDMEATNYGDMTQNPGTFPIGLQNFSAAPLVDEYPLDVAGANTGFAGQNLDWVIEQHPESTVMEKKKVEENGGLLPAACIVGNIPGWQASSPTYPSLVDFETASAPENMANFRTEPLLTVPEPIAPARPASTGPASSVGQASAAMMGTPMSRKSRSSHGAENRNPSSLFAFHPVDHSSGVSPSAVAGPSSLREPGPFYHPQQFLTPPQPSGLSARRSIGGLSIQTSAVAGSDVYPTPYDTSTSTVSNMIPTYINTAPMSEHIPVHSHYDALAGPMSAPLYPSYDTMLPFTPVAARRASPAPAPASVLQPAPGNINVAPPLSADLPPPLVAVEIPTPRASSQKHVDIPPILTSAPLVIPKARPDGAAPAPRTIAALPSKRKVSAPKSRKASGKKGSGAAQPFCSFINFTADDAAVISAGVAPSGSKNKRKADESASPTESSHKRSRQSDSP